MKKIILLIFSLIILTIVLPLSIRSDWDRVYHITPSGNDSNDCQTTATACRTISKANNLSLHAGDIVQFENGVWRTPLDDYLDIQSGNTTGNITYTCLNCTFLGSYNLSSYTWGNEGGNIWNITGFPRDIGNLIFNGSTIPHPQTGIKEEARSELNAQAEFAMNYTTGTLYLYSTSNPNTYYSGIEAADDTPMFYASGSDYYRITNFTGLYNGRHFVESLLNDYAFVDHNTFVWGGGAYQIRPNASLEGELRYGNGIQFGIQMNKIFIEYNNVSQIYDACISPQSWDGGHKENNVYIRYNIGAYCHYPYEYFNTNLSVLNQNHSVIFNTWIVGGEWSHNQRPDGGVDQQRISKGNMTAYNYSNNIVLVLNDYGLYLGSASTTSFIGEYTLRNNLYHNYTGGVTKMRWKTNITNLVGVQSFSQENGSIEVNPEFKDFANGDYTPIFNSTACGRGDGFQDLGALPCERHNISEKRDLTRAYLYNLTNHGALAGHWFGYSDNGSMPTLTDAQVRSGKNFSIKAGDYNNISTYAPFFETINTRFIQHSDAGGIAMMSMHLRNPETLKDARNLTINITAAITPGTTSNTQFNADLDIVAAGLLELERNDVVVIFDLWHEMNGGWFYWGDLTQAEFKGLWNYTRSYFLSKGLTNILWHYSPNKGYGNFSDYYPGADVVDTVGVDYYSIGTLPAWYTNAEYTELRAFGKPIFFTEASHVSGGGSPSVVNHNMSDTLTQLKTNFSGVVAYVSYFSIWSINYTNNLTYFMNDSWIITLDEIDLEYEYDGTPYYVNASGNDSLAGTSPASAWKTLAKVRSIATTGDTVLFNRDDVWQNEYLYFDGKNTMNFSAYGSGKMPLFDNRENVSGYTTAANWTNITSVVYCINVAGDPIRLWMNNTELTKGNSEVGINSSHKWFYNSSIKRLCVYSSINPSSAFANLLNLQDAQARTFSFYSGFGFTFEQLNITGGRLSSIGLFNVTFCNFSDSAIGANSLRGIYLSGYNNVLNAETHNNIFDNVSLDWNIRADNTYNDQGSADGVYFGCGAWNNTIINSRFQDWGHSAAYPYCVNSTYAHGASYNNVSNSVLDGRNLGYGRPFNIDGSEGNASYNYFINNSVSNFRNKNQINGDHNVVTYNLLEHFNNTARSGDGAKGGYGIEVSVYCGDCVSHDNKIAHNTIAYVEEPCLGVVDYSYVTNLYRLNFSDNICIEPGFDSERFLNGVGIYVQNNSRLNNNTFTNNFFENPGKVSYRGVNYSISDFNNADSNSDIISGNMNGTSLLDSSYVPSYNSPVCSASSDGGDIGAYTCGCTALSSWLNVTNSTRLCYGDYVRNHTGNYTPVIAVIGNVTFDGQGSTMTAGDYFYEYPGANRYGFQTSNPATPLDNVAYISNMSLKKFNVNLGVYRLKGGVVQGFYLENGTDHNLLSSRNQNVIFRDILGNITTNSNVYFYGESGVHNSSNNTWINLTLLGSRSNNCFHPNMPGNPGTSYGNKVIDFWFENCATAADPAGVNGFLFANGTVKNSPNGFTVKYEPNFGPYAFSHDVEFTGIDFINVTSDFNIWNATNGTNIHDNQYDGLIYVYVTNNAGGLQLRLYENSAQNLTIYYASTSYNPLTQVWLNYSGVKNVSVLNDSVTIKSDGIHNDLIRNGTLIASNFDLYNFTAEAGYLYSVGDYAQTAVPNVTAQQCNRTGCYAINYTGTEWIINRNATCTRTQCI